MVGGGGSNDGEGGEDIEIHATTFQYGTAQCDDLAPVGGPVIQKQLTPAFSEYMHLTSEPIPAAATDSGHRTTPDLFGFGLLDAVPEAEILALADPLGSRAGGDDGVLACSGVKPLPGLLLMTERTEPFGDSFGEESARGVRWLERRSRRRPRGRR